MNAVIEELANARKMKRAKIVHARFGGCVADAVEFAERNQLCEVALWRKFVQLFRTQENGFCVRWRTWRGEFWGKMMRGACMILQYTENEGMYRIVEASVRDMLTVQEECGRISAYSKDTEFTAWDLWERKYVMLGMMYFLRICRDETLQKQILSSLCRQADHILLSVGEGKRDIRKCSQNWGGMNSCSLLEPMVRLYRLTGKQCYLDFAAYIISTGFTDKGDLVELAYEDRVAPYRYPVEKAYEMMSCFEGLLQYYCVTGIEKYKTAVINFGYRVAQGEVSVIGGCGAWGELFSNTVQKQTRTDFAGVMQETCVTVTWMKLAAALLELTGDACFADHIERSFYNAYLGSLNTHRVPYSDYPQELDVPQVLPYDSYSPLVAGNRGRKVGGYGIFDDGSFYGCCACIGAAGVGLIPQTAVLQVNGGLAVNFYEPCCMELKTPAGRALHLRIDTDYPYDGRVEICVEPEQAEHFALLLRIPSWCREAVLCQDGVRQQVTSGYVRLSREWDCGDRLVLELSMPVVMVAPPAGADNGAYFKAYCKGPIVLAADMRMSDPNGVYSIVHDGSGAVPYRVADHREIPDCKLCVALEQTNGTTVRLIDYASAGKTWKNDSKTAAWLRCQSLR